jgi:pimeloyl-ACP methyl ester carboxylesterase
MQGPNELVCTGTFKDWDRWADLPRIGTETLVMGAKYDEMSPEDLRKMADSMPNVRAWISGKGSHFAMYDDQPAYFTYLNGKNKRTILRLESRIFSLRRPSTINASSSGIKPSGYDFG